MTSFNFDKWLEKSVKKSGVPVRLEDKRVLRQLVRLFKAA